jgi:hypothetical protein
MNTFLRIAVGNFLIMNIACHSFIYRMDVLDKQQSPISQNIDILDKNQPIPFNQLILGLSDFHDKTHPATHAQQAYIDGILDRLKHIKALVLVEDLSSPNTATGLIGCGSFSVDSRGGILGGLSTKCKEKGIPVQNIEFRFCRVAAFGPVLNHLNKAPNTLEPANKITINTIYKEIQQAIAHIQLFSDGPNVQKYYNEYIDEVLKELNQLHLNNTSTINIADYITQQAPSFTRLDTLRRLLTFDSSLLDMNFVHAILQASDKQIILIVAGGAHINNVCELLEKIGYKRVYNTPVSYVQEHNLNECIGSRIIDETYCVKPEATDLKTIDQFIK